MKKHFLLECHAVIDAIYDPDPEKDDYSSLLFRLRIGLHLLLCPPCLAELRNLRHAEEIMKADFLPSSPDFEDPVMERLRYEEECANEGAAASSGFSLRGWVIIGFFLLLSLSTSFFGGNFAEIAAAEGLSFLLPVGLTVGMIVTCYGALFIGSHLKELSARFRLR